MIFWHLLGTDRQRLEPFALDCSEAVGIIRTMALNSRPLHAGGRSIGLLVLIVLVAGIVGSVVSYFMAGVFPHGPVRDFFFKSLAVGIPTVVLNLGFATLTFGLSFAVTTVAVLLVVLAIYLWYKF